MKSSMSENIFVEASWYICFGINIDRNKAMYKIVREICGGCHI